MERRCDSLFVRYGRDTHGFRDTVALFAYQEHQKGERDEVMITKFHLTSSFNPTRKSVRLQCSFLFSKGRICGQPRLIVMCIKQ